MPETNESAARSEHDRVPGWLLGVALVALIAVGATLAAFALSGYEVVEKGQLLPYTEGKIYKVQFGNGAILYFEPELKPSLDLLNGYLLTGIAFVALTFAILLTTLRRDWRNPAAFLFWLLFVGSSALAVDEVVGVHESLGHNLQFLAGLPLVERPDDAVILFLAVPSALVLYLFRRVIFASRGALYLFVAALGLFILSAVADLLSLPGEEPAEIVATIVLVAATVTLGLHHLRGTSAASA